MGKLNKGSAISRTFSYQKDGVNLSFTLRIDVKNELKAFVELLEAAVADVKEEADKK